MARTRTCVCAAVRPSTVGRHCISCSATPVRLLTTTCGSRRSTCEVPNAATSRRATTSCSAPPAAARISTGLALWRLSICGAAGAGTRSRGRGQYPGAREDKGQRGGPQHPKASKRAPAAAAPPTRPPPRPAREGASTRCLPRAGARHSADAALARAPRPRCPPALAAAAAERSCSGGGGRTGVPGRRGQ